MHRPRRLVPIVSVAVTIAVGPLLAGIALAADPITVRPGDTLTAISRRHGTPVAEIVRLNDLADANRIYAGQRLRIAAERARPSKRGPAASDGRDRADRAAGRVHTVRFGEHLTGISRQYGVSISAIVAANNISNPSRIFAGQRLVIPGRAASRPAHKPAPAPARAKERNRPAAGASDPKRHTVRPGEHLTGIAKRYGVRVSAIVAANGIADPSRIFVGQRLVIPGVSATRATGRTAPAMPASMRAIMAQRGSIRALVVAEAKRYRVPRAFALAVAWQESGWQQDVVSSAGAVGVMQLLPATGDWVGEAMLGRTVNIHRARDNVRAGVRLLRHYLDRYAGNIDLVLAAYYQGQTAADRHGVYPVSRPYIASIKAIMRLLGR